MKTITIMADFGNGPYAWLRDGKARGGYVEPNIADAVAGFCGRDGVPVTLEAQFSNWIRRFETEYDKPAFDRALFHAEGIVLVRSLRRAIGSAYTGSR